MTELSIFYEGPPAPCPRPFNLAAYVLMQADKLADKPALEVYQSAEVATDIWSYGALKDAVLRTAGGLAAQGIQPGDRVLLRIGNAPDFPILFLAAIAMGAVPVPTSALLTEPEVRYIIDELDPALVCFSAGVEKLDSLPCASLDQTDLRALRSANPVTPINSHPDDLAYLIYTSGTSGKPRAVMHAHRAVWARRMMWQGWYGLQGNDRMLHAGAFNWTYTLGTGLLDPWAIGGTSMIYTGPPARGIWAQLAARHAPTIFAAAPGVYRQLLSEPVSAEFAQLRHGLSAGEKLPQSLRTRWQEATGKPIYEALGMSEVSTFISTGPSVPAKDRATGRPQTGRHVAVVDANGPVPVGRPGVLAIARGDQGLMLGYRNQPEETAAKFQGDWFLTGDTVSMDDEGYITYLGRDDDMINAGGYRVSPLEIETTLLTHPAIKEAAAVEYQVKAETKVIAAFYVSDDHISEQTLATHCAQNLARYKCPRIFTRLDALPKGANNKLARRELRALPTG
ncbi:MAG: acyl--CoA ligase [Rhodobacteraceae bacterium]|nr:acyl--CoA ligase [Paracoccaceae bacterium]